MLRSLRVWPVAALCAACVRAPVAPTPAAATDAGCTSSPAAAFRTGHYPNLFVQLLGLDSAAVQARVEAVFRQLFHGADETQRVYYPVGADMAYVEDILHADVRSEGMSYGLMIAVQLDRKAEFDRLWKWAKTYMQHRTGPAAGYFAWQLRTDGTVMDSTTASDGEEWIALALLFAAHRWGDGPGIFAYGAEARALLGRMLHKSSEPGNDGSITSMFDPVTKQVVFVPERLGAGFTDPSYHLPHYYELWGRWAEPADRPFWCEAAAASRDFLKRATHPLTGLAPDYARFDGTPLDMFNGGHQDFRYDAWRVAMNVGVDHVWFAADPWSVVQSDRLLRFFSAQGMGTYGNLYTVDGRPLGTSHSAGLVAANAVAALAASEPARVEFVRELWQLETPSGPYRYYDGLLYLLGLLQVSGNFRIYSPAE